MEFIKAKTILTKNKNGQYWYGNDYNMNLYKGCSHGCIYCDSRSECYHNSVFEQIRGKENAIEILERELSSKKFKGVVGTGAMSDPYNPLEKQYQLTQKALHLISKYGFGISIDTKSTLILRDIDILKKINEKNNVIVKITITTPHDQLSKIIEPSVASSTERFQTVKLLNAEGIFTGIMLNPVLPFLTDKKEDICLLVQKAHESGAKFIYTYMGMTLRDIQRDYYYKKLDTHFKGLKERYIKTFGNQYNCSAVQAKELYKIFTEECKRYGILYKMEDIIKAYKKEIGLEQISLF